MQTSLPAAEEMSRPELENATWVTGPEWRRSVCTTRADARCHSNTVWSSPADAALWPSGDTATARTGAACPRISRTHAPVPTSHSRSVQSCEAEST